MTKSSQAMIKVE